MQFPVAVATCHVLNSHIYLVLPVQNSADIEYSFITERCVGPVLTYIDQYIEGYLHIVLDTFTVGARVS